MNHRLRFKPRPDNTTDVMEWVKVNKIKPTRKIGDRVSYRYFGEEYDAEIIEFFEATAEALCFVEGLHQKDKDPYISGNKTYGHMIPYEDLRKIS
jgi:hypothetical protein